MINAKELMIGNYVTINNPKYRPDDTGKILVVTEIKTEQSTKHFESGQTISGYLLENKYKDTFGQYVEFIQPIPITEQWLLDFGAKKKEHMPYYYFDYILIKIVEGTYEVSVKFFGGYNSTDFCIHYVHHLQNLSFALSGKELNLNKTK